MAATHHPGGSTKTLPNVIGRHDGHADGHLNCIALRHGWSRTFSISPQELSILDYETLETVLEVNTLKLRPVGVRIFIENPAESGNWSKIRPWKHDGSLQSVLVQEFFEKRREGGIVTRVDVRDGSDRHAEGDTLSLRTVGSRILNRRTGTDTEDGKSTTSRRAGWFGLSRNASTRSRARTLGTNTDVDDEEAPHNEGQPPPPPAKPSFFSLLRPHPKIPNQTPQRRSIFEFFRAKLLQASSTKPTNAHDQQRNNSDSTPEEQQLVEVEQLRKRGWIPPGLARRQRSLKERLRADGLPTDGSGGSRNPFFGSSRSVLSRLERKKQKAAAAAVATDNTDTDAMVGDDPFADDAGAGVDRHGPDEINEQDVDDFFEVERPTSMMEMTDPPTKDKSWSKFKPSKDRKNKSKARAAAAATNVVPVKGTLGGGADVVQKPRDAFPDSPHHRAVPEDERSFD